MGIESPFLTTLISMATLFASAFPSRFGCTGLVVSVLRLFIIVMVVRLAMRSASLSRP
jgi:hypothetical protein